MNPSERKFLFVMVRDALQRRSGDQIEPKRLGNKHIPALRSLGYVKGNDLTRKAFEELFATFEPISCPSEIQQVVDSFGIEIVWRKPHGIMETNLDPAGEGSAYRNVKTIFIRPGARCEAWLHEFGHIVFGCVKNTPAIWELFKELQREAEAAYELVSHEQMTPVLHAVTRQPITPAPGKYMLINGNYHGLDHSGDGVDGEADEMWALLFEEYFGSGNIKPNVRIPLEAIFAAIKAMPKPLDPRDKD